MYVGVYVTQSLDENLSPMMVMTPHPSVGMWCLWAGAAFQRQSPAIAYRRPITSHWVGADFTWDQGLWPATTTTTKVPICHAFKYTKYYETLT